MFTNISVIRIRTLIIYFSCMISIHFLQACSNKFYYIEHENPVIGLTFHNVSTSSLDDCVKKCSQHKNCGGANFYVDQRQNVHCLLVDTEKKEGAISSIFRHESLMYSIRRLCSTSKAERKLCANKPVWTFQRFSNYILKSNSFIMSTTNNIDLDACLWKCRQTDNCAASFYSNTKRICHLSKVSLQNINSVQQYFSYDEYFDLYELNCAKGFFESPHCNLLRVSKAGFIDIFTAKLQLANQKECEAECMHSMQYLSKGRKISSSLCRSYTYDSSTHTCYLSHLNQRTFGRNILESLDLHRSYGEVENCMQFGLDCKPKSLVLRGKSLKMFRGYIRTKHNDTIACERHIGESYEFSAEIPFDECKLQKSGGSLPSHTGFIMVKEGSTDLITSHDKNIQVSCRLEHLHSSQSQQFDGLPPLAPSQMTAFNRSNLYHDPTVSAELLLNQSNQSLGFVPPRIPIFSNVMTKFSSEKDSTEKLLRDSKPRKRSKPKFSLEVLDRHGRLADVVDINDTGYLQISMIENESNSMATYDPNRFFFISELVADNLPENRSIELIDSRGCISNTTFVKEMRRVDDRKLWISILFGGFRDQAKVTYQTLVKSCTTNCFPECNRKFYLDTRNSTKPNKLIANQNQSRHIRSYVGRRSILSI